VWRVNEEVLSLLAKTRPGPLAGGGMVSSEAYDRELEDSGPCL